MAARPFALLDLSFDMKAPFGAFFEAGFDPFESTVMVIVHELVPFLLEELVLNGQYSVHFMKLFLSMNR